MIVKPREMDFSQKKISMIVAGLPGIGKTTLALSAPKPLLIDLDGGVSRVEAKYREDTMEVSTYAELKDEIKKEDLSAYETVVIDTGGKLFELMKPYLIAQSPKNGKADGSLSLQGYGAAKREYGAFVDSVKALGKNLVLVFHASEVTLDRDEGTTGLRIRIEGGTRDEIWDDMDLGAFMEIKGGKRTLGFSNCDRYYAKGTHGIHGVYEVDDLSAGGKNDFLARLFDSVRDELNKESAEANEYREAMAMKPAIEACGDAESLTKALKDVSASKGALTSKAELKHAIAKRAKELGLAYDAKAGAFAPCAIS